MNDHLSVQHPLDFSKAEFDFWIWRLFRRFITDHLRSAAMGSPFSELSDIAARLEEERYTAEDQAHIEQLLGHTSHNLKTTRGMLRSLAEWNQKQGVEIQQHWFLPAIRPDWEAIPLTRPVFSGKVGPDYVRARLPESTEIVPPYRIIWIDEKGEEGEAEHVRETPVGEFIEYAPAIWDWLFARRLTLAGLHGMGSWPEGMRPPMLLPIDWENLPRPF